MKIKRSWLVAGVVATVVVVAGAAQAYIRVSGVGHGQVSTVSLINGVRVSGNSSGAIGPDAPATVRGFLTNTNHFTVRVSVVKVRIIGVVPSSGCAASNFTAADSTNNGAGFIVPGATADGPGSVPWTTTVSLNETGTRQNSCVNRDVIFDLVAMP
jgi:hypothetical protein